MEGLVYGRSVIEPHHERQKFVLASQEFDREFAEVTQKSATDPHGAAVLWNAAELKLRDATVQYLQAVANSVAEATGMDLNHFIRAPELHHRVAAE